jgi:hypothetical protein
MALRARRPPSAAAEPGAGSTSRARAGVADRPHLPRGAGEHFQPVPHALLVAPYEDRDGPSVTVPAPAGTPVHAVCAGTVREADAGVLRIAGEDGFTWEYTGVGEVRVPQGQQVDAGGIIGVLGGGSGPRQVLRLSVVDRQGAPARLHEVLRGAVDPNDLGYGATGTGIDIDPDAHVAPRSTPVPAPAPRPTGAQAPAVPEAPVPPQPSAGAWKPPPAPPRVVPASGEGGLRPPPAPPRPPPRPRRAPSPVADDVAPEPEPAPASTADHPAASEPVSAVEPPDPAHREPAAPAVGGSSGAVADASSHAAVDAPVEDAAPRDAAADVPVEDAAPRDAAADVPLEDAAPEPPADDKRRRAAMLIANRRRRPADPGSSS